MTKLQGSDSFLHLELGMLETTKLLTDVLNLLKGEVLKGLELVVGYIHALT